MSGALLEVHNATLRRGDSTLLSEVSFALGPGEIIGIAGSNGAGKSTLLRLACGEYLPSSGSVRLAGKSLSDLQARERAQQLAVLPQAAHLQFDFTVRQVVSLGRSPYGDGSGAGEQLVNRSLGIFELESLADRTYPSLSGGEKQRTQLARVLTQLLPQSSSSDLSGQVLILDEPTSAMDIRHQERFLQLVAELRDRRCAILLVMHDINLLCRCADRLLYLKHGHMLSLGPTEEQLNEAALSAVFDFPLKISPAFDQDPRFVYPDPSALAN
ncbi:MAG: heme ABC transporter ATP-binding protein [Congregibacter sp.]|nr:heme ABC transporter ATP-binding protein [Congregibacter sp.]